MVENSARTGKDPMEFPRTTRYALRAMAYLAIAGPETTVRAQALAEATGIPLAYLSKVLRSLVQAELLDSKRGHHGGFALKREPAEIRLVEIMSAVGYTLDSNECVFGVRRCNPNNPCPFHPAWSRLKESLVEWAETTYLSEVR